MLVKGATAVIAVLFVISRNNGPRYNGTRLGIVDVIHSKNVFFIEGILPGFIETLLRGLLS